MTTKISSFEDMPVWKAGRALAQNVYLLTGQGKTARDFGLRDQMQRAVVSIVSNIAEGFERNNNKEFLTFLRYAKGSVAELRTQLMIAHDVGYIDNTSF